MQWEREPDGGLTGVSDGAKKGPGCPQVWLSKPIRTNECKGVFSGALVAGFPLLISIAEHAFDSWFGCGNAESCH